MLQSEDTMSIISSSRSHNFDSDAPLVIRRATGADRGALERLAGRDSAIVPEGPMLVAEVGGELRVAATLDGKVAIADPFTRTAELLALLRTRAHQLTSAERRPLRIVARTAPPRRGHALRERAA
jgi:hypothetical protein